MKKEKKRFKEKHPVLYEVLDYINIIGYIKENPWECFVQIVTAVIVSFITTLAIGIIKAYTG